MSNTILKYLWKRARVHPLYLIASICALMSMFFEQAYIPSLIGKLVQSQAYVPWVMSQLIGVTLLKEFVLYRASHYILDSHIAPRMKNAITKEAMSHLIQARFTYFENNPPAELNAKIEALHKAVDTLDIVLYHFISKFLVLLLYLYTLWHRHWLLAVMVLAWLINFGFCMAAMRSSKVLGLSQKWAEICVQNAGRRVDLLRNILVVRLFSNPAREMRFVSTDADAETEVKCKLEARMFCIWYWIWSTYYATQCGAIAFYWLYQLPVGDLVATMISFEFVAWSIMFIAYQWSNLVSYISEIQNGLSLFDSELDASLVERIEAAQ